MRVPHKTVVFSVLLLGVGVWGPSADAKRRPPKDVAPIVVGHTRYVVPHWGAFHDKDQNGGYVQAWDRRTGKLLWDRLIYRVRYDRQLEGDVQDVFITKIWIKGNRMFVTNESKEQFEMDISTGVVRLAKDRGTKTGRRKP